MQWHPAWPSTWCKPHLSSCQGKSCSASSPSSPGAGEASFTVGTKAASANILNQGKLFVSMDGVTAKDKCNYAGEVSLVQGLRVTADFESKFRLALDVAAGDFPALVQFWRDKPTHVQSAVGVGSRHFHLESHEQAADHNDVSEAHLGSSSESGQFSVLGISSSRSRGGQWRVDSVHLQQHGHVGKGTLDVTVGSAKPAVIRPPKGTPYLTGIWEFIRDARVACKVRLLYLVYEALMYPPANVEELRQSPFFTNITEQEYIFCYKGDRSRIFKARVCGQDLRVDVTGVSDTKCQQPGYAWWDGNGPACTQVKFNHMLLNPNSWTINVQGTDFEHGHSLGEARCCMKYNKRGCHEFNGKSTLTLPEHSQLVFLDRSVQARAAGWCRQARTSVSAGGKKLEVNALPNHRGNKNEIIFGAAKLAFLEVCVLPGTSESTLLDMAIELYGAMVL